MLVRQRPHIFRTLIDLLLAVSLLVLPVQLLAGPAEGMLMSVDSMPCHTKSPPKSFQAKGGLCDCCDQHCNLDDCLAGCGLLHVTTFLTTVAPTGFTSHAVLLDHRPGNLSGLTSPPDPRPPRHSLA
ncbi:hypothetical protein QVG61_07020 [Thiohalobacter sp. IOR34]|uniref:hypothetical protein n=1 Tax=Thiohalobacter sp. IOR34 TaxID=3057176 RepID=UPI0025B1D9E5|nr:hypothetical protein [Thiohalobacter sp. IOR34]WJW74276.1 hypothetical protein QVG61_07020 [Thiohalobacter sp. IOR34]